MGTRGAIGFRLDGVEHIVYNHFDSYPDYLGNQVVTFLRGRADAIGLDGLVGELKQRVRSLQPIDRNIPPTEEQKAWCIKLGLADTSVSTRSTDDWYCLLRNAQGDIDQFLTARYYEPDNDFMFDGLFCEYAYIVNLDDETLEFYEGFQMRDGKRHAGRYWDGVPDYELLPFKQTHTRADGSTYTLENQYGPVVLKLVFPLKEVSEVAPEAIVDRMNRTHEFKSYVDGSKDIELAIDHDGKWWLVRRKDGARISVKQTHKGYAAWVKGLPDDARRFGAFTGDEYDRCSKKRLQMFWDIWSDINPIEDQPEAA